MSSKFYRARMRYKHLPALVSTIEAAWLLGLSRHTVNGMIDRKEFTGIEKLPGSCGAFGIPLAQLVALIGPITLDDFTGAAEFAAKRATWKDEPPGVEKKRRHRVVVATPRIYRIAEPRRPLWRRLLLWLAAGAAL